MKTIAKLYRWLILVGNALRPVVLLILRLYWGWEFFQTGRGKLLHIAQPIAYFDSLGIPFPIFNAWFVSILECVGGIFLLVGFATRLTAIPLVIDMMVAYVAADLDALKSIFSNTDRFLSATPFNFLLVSVLLLTFGPGLFSVDAVIRQFWRRSSLPASSSA